MLSSKKRQKGTCTFEYPVHSWKFIINSFNNTSLRASSGVRQPVTPDLQSGRRNCQSGEGREIIVRVAFITEHFLCARPCAESFIHIALLSSV